jgi:hypothetical protein
MHAQQLNRLAAVMITALAAVALLDVVVLGYFRAPLKDEGAGAFIFQFSFVAMALVAVLFLATADWTHPVSIVRRLAIPALLSLLALGALFYLENYFYPSHFPTFYQ